KPLPARHERPQQEIAERAVLEQDLSRLLTLDGDVAHRLGHHGGEEDGLSGEQVRLAEEAARAVAVDLRTSLVEHGRLAFDDRDQRIASVTDPKEDVAHLGAPLLAVLGEHGGLTLGKHRRPGSHARTLFSTLLREAAAPKPSLSSRSRVSQSVSRRTSRPSGRSRRLYACCWCSCRALLRVRVRVAVRRVPPSALRSLLRGLMRIAMRGRWRVSRRTSELPLSEDD